MNTVPCGFKTEYARSKHSQCRGCGQYIPKSVLRIGAIYNSSKEHYRDPCHWYDKVCFFNQRFGVSDASEIQGFHKVSSDDQEYLKAGVQKLKGLSSPPATRSRKPSEATSPRLPQAPSASSSPPMKDQKKLGMDDQDEELLTTLRFRSKEAKSALEKPPVASPAPSRAPLRRSNSLFLEAVKSGNVEEAKVSLEAGADPNAEVTEGVTALTFSVFKGFVDLTKEILKFSPEVNTQTKLGETPLFLAASAGSLDLVQLLLDHHAEKSIPNALGITPHDIAAEKGYREIAEGLVDDSHLSTRHQSTHSSLPLFSLEMGGANPSNSSFSSTASTQVDDPMLQATTIIEPAPARSPAQATSHHKVDEEPDIDPMDTFAQQTSHFRASETIPETQFPPLEESKLKSKIPEAGPPKQSKRDLEQIVDILIQTPSKRAKTSHQAPPPLPASPPHPAPFRVQEIKQGPTTTTSSSNAGPTDSDKNPLSSFLREVGLQPEKFLKIFEDEEIDFDALLTLQERHLADLGLKMGPRNKILAGIAKYKSSPPSSASRFLYQPAPIAASTSQKVKEERPDSLASSNQSGEYEMAPVYIKVKHPKGANSKPVVSSPVTPRRSTRRGGNTSGGAETSETEVSEHDGDASTIIIPKPTTTGAPLPPQPASAVIEGELKLPTDVDHGYQSTLEISPEKRPPPKSSIDSAKTIQDPASLTPATTLASTIVQPIESMKGSVSQLLSEIGHQSYNSSRQLNNSEKPDQTSSPPPSSRRSPSKSPTKSFKAPEFNFKNEPPQTEETLVDFPAPASATLPDVSQTQPYSSSTDKKLHYTVTKPKVNSPPKPQTSSPPSSSSKLAFIMGSIRTPIKDYLASYTPRPSQTVGTKEVIRIELKPAVNLVRPQGFVSVTNDKNEAVKGKLEVDLSLVTFLPTFPLKPGTTYTVTVHADHTEVVGTGALRDYSWSFFVM